MRSERDIINIDESCLNKNTKISYSWLTTGKNWCVTNIKFQNNVSIIYAICTNWFAFSMISHTTINRNTFDIFLDKLSKAIKFQTTLDLSEFIIILDNWAIHQSKLTRNFFEDNR